MTLPFRVAAPLLAFLLAVACYGEITPVVTNSPSPIPTSPWCPTEPISRFEFKIDSPESGLSYTRQVPVHGWVPKEIDGLVDIEITTSNGGLLASSQIQQVAEPRGDLHEIEGTIVLQLLSERQRACVSISGHGWTTLVPIRVGGANP